MTTHLRNACIGALLIASSPVHALGLGDATVRSGLGERLLIEIPLTAEPATDAGCFDVTVTGAAAGLIRVERLPGALVIRSTQRVREPLLGLEVHARCPGEPSLTRSYTLFVDPPTRLTLEDRRVSRSALAPLQPAKSTAPPATRPQPAADGQPGTTDRIAQPIDPRGRYTVTAGDTAWTIVERAVNGSASWQLIDDLVAANPDAFVNGDADRLRSGAVLTLPFAAGNAVAVTVQSAEPVLNPATPVGAASDESVPVESASARGSLPVAALEPAPEVASPMVEETGNADTADASARTDALLSVVGDAARIDASDSPFKAADTPPAEPSANATMTAENALEPIPAPGAEIADARRTPNWADKLIAGLGGALLAFIAYVVWQVYLGFAARRRRLAATEAFRTETASRASHVPFIDRGTEEATQAGGRTVPAAAAPPPLPGENELVTDDAGFDAVTFDFVLPDNAPAEPDFSVDVLDPRDRTLPRTIDEDTLRMLEQDYEEELTKTQQLRKEIAEIALGISGSYDADANTDEDAATARMPAPDTDTGDTDQMPEYELDVDDTAEMPEAESFTADDLETLDIADATIAEFTASLVVEDDLTSIEHSQTARIDTDSYEANSDPDSPADEAPTSKLARR